MGIAAKATSTACWPAGRSCQTTSAIANAGSTPWRMVIRPLASAGASRKAPKRRPAPTAIKPSGSAAAPMRDSVMSTTAGSTRPARLALKPVTVAMIKGFFSSSLP